VVECVPALLLQDLLRAKQDLKLARPLKRLAKYDARILDDIGCVQLERDEIELLFTLLAERCERGSVMLTSNLPFSKCERIFKVTVHSAERQRNRGDRHRARARARHSCSSLVIVIVLVIRHRHRHWYPERGHRLRLRLRARWRSLSCSVSCRLR